MFADAPMCTWRIEHAVGPGSRGGPCEGSGRMKGAKAMNARGRSPGWLECLSSKLLISTFHESHLCKSLTAASQPAFQASHP